MKKELLLQSTISDIITSSPSYMAFFLENGIDCTKTPDINLKEALENNTIDNDIFFTSLYEIPSTRTLSFPLSLSLLEFTNTIYAHYHVITRERSASLLQEITEFLKEENVHSNILDLYNVFMTEMEDHLSKEEKILFPLIQNYEHSNELDAKQILKRPMEKMESEHEHHQINMEALLEEGARIKNISEKSLSIYNAIEWLFLFTMEHVHVENNILFKRIRTA
ncbi:MAG: hemerythrin domain-containing protein [Desulfovibrionaceae bacterium]